MEIVVLIAQLMIAAGIFNVWILRFNKSTEYRPGTAKNMKEEFSCYGLPSGLVYFVGGFKVLFAIFLVVGIWLPELVRPAAAGMAALMSGAIVMHLKVKDPVKKAFPASFMLALSLVVTLFANQNG